MARGRWIEVKTPDQVETCGSLSDAYPARFFEAVVIAANDPYDL
ncbi:hypothetical protein [Bradyrhizobium sp. USDA 10063]